VGKFSLNRGPVCLRRSKRRQTRSQGKALQTSSTAMDLELSGT
jgi:hypothetical protein